MNLRRLCVPGLVMVAMCCMFGIAAGEDLELGGIEISGVGAVSYRNVTVDEDTASVEDSAGFQLDHLHLKLFRDLSDELSVTVVPCFAHMDTFSLIEANLQYTMGEKYILTMGRFLVPFGQFNLRSYPDGFNTISRPLLYQSHEDNFLRPDNNSPAPLFFSQQADVGVSFSSSLWLGKKEDNQLWYGVYLVNGLQGTNDINSLDATRKWEDNNNTLTVGGKVSYSMPLTELVDLSAGLSFQTGRYDVGDDLQYNATALDLVLAKRFDETRKLTLRSEYVISPRDVEYGELNNALNLLTQESELSGFYTTLEYTINEKFEVVAQYDFLEKKQPTLYGANTNLFDISRLGDDTTETSRYLIGINYTPHGIVKFKLEYSTWDIEGNDASGLALQAVAAF